MDHWETCECGRQMPVDEMKKHRPGGVCPATISRAGVDGPTLIEQKRCSGCGETKRVADFYDYRAQGGALFARCKACTRRSQEAYWQRTKLEEAADKIAHLNRMPKKARAGTVYAMLANGSLNKQDFISVVREVAL